MTPLGVALLSTSLNAAGLARICHIAAMPLEMLELLLGNQAAILR